MRGHATQECSPRAARNRATRLPKAEPGGVRLSSVTTYRGLARMTTFNWFPGSAWEPTVFEAPPLFPEANT